MGRPPRPLPRDAIEKLRTVRHKIRTVGQHQRWLAVWLRASLGLTTRQVATALGWCPSHVSKIQCQYIREGDAAFRGPGRGGDRRPSGLRQLQREALLAELESLRFNRGMRLSYRAVKAECEAAAGHPLNRSTIYRIIRRQGWRPEDLQRDLPPRLRRAIQENPSDPLVRAIASDPSLWR